MGGVILTTALASACSNENSTDNPGRDDRGNGRHVVTFKIANSNDAQTRAGDDPEADDKFAAGEGKEADIENVLLVFFFDNGDFFSAVEPTFGDGGEDNLVHEQEGYLKAQVTLKEVNGKRPAYVLCILNGVGRHFDRNNPALTLNEVDLSLAKPSKEQMLAAEYGFDVELDDAGKGPKDNLIMTNSVYPDADNGDKLIDLTPIKKENFWTNDDPRDISEVPAVHIDVERVNARINIKSKLGDPGAIEDSEVKIGEDMIKIVPHVLSIQVGQLTKKSYFIKSLEGRDSYKVIDWKSKNHYPRSYWATSPELIGWNARDDEGNFVGGDGDYRYMTWNGMGEEDQLLYYPQENTSDYPTSVVVKARLEDEEGNPIEDIVDITGTRKYFMTLQGYKNSVATDLKKAGLKFKYVDEAKNTVVSDEWADYVTLVESQNADDKSFHVRPTVVPDGKKLRQTDADIANAKLAGFDPVLYYKEGMCYYYTEILHDLYYKDEEGELVRSQGIVRNHVYEITLTGLQGLGSPVFDGDKEIIPNRPEEIIELNAEIHPLKWRKVSQNSILK